MAEILIPYNELVTITAGILTKRGVPASQSQSCAEVISMSTADGIISHGIGRLPRLVSQLAGGAIRPDRKSIPILQSRNREIWDGQSGIGIINALDATDRAIELAGKEGMAIISLKNTTHWLRGGTYGWRAADNGFAFLCWTNTMPNMAPWGSEETMIGNNPMVLAFPGKEGRHFVLDMAMSQYSYGSLGEYSRSDTELPTIGGWDSEGDFSTSPRDILQSGRVLPAGFWKGSALSIMLDLFTSSLSLGNATLNIKREETNISQIFVAIKLNKEIIDHGFSIESEMIAAFEALGNKGSARYPGQRAFEKRSKSLDKGIAIPETLWSEIVKLKEQ